MVVKIHILRVGYPRNTRLTNFWVEVGREYARACKITLKSLGVSTSTHVKRYPQLRLSIVGKRILSNT